MSHEAHHFACRTRWTGAAVGGTTDYETYSREVHVEVAGKPPLTMSAAPVFRGDATLHNPEDLLLAALSACHFLSYAALCARSGVVMIAYDDDATATMEEVAHVTKFTKVVLRPNVVLVAGTTAQKADLAERLHEKAHRECFIASSVNFPVTFTARIRLANP
ncbi:OsmC family protein [soil metagenome]